MKRLFLINVVPALMAMAGFAQAQIQIQPAVLPGGPGIIGGGGVPELTPEQYFQGMSVRQRALQSTWVVVGTMEAEKQSLDLTMYQGAQVKTSYKVFKLKIKDILIGDKVEQMTVLVGPADPVQQQFGEIPKGMVQPRPWVNTIQVIDGQDGVFFISKHPTSTEHYSLTGGCVPLNPLDTKYKEKLEEIKQLAGVLTDPMKYLKSDKAEERFMAAMNLVSKYRSYPQNAIYGVDQEDIPEDESKLILKALLDGNWEQYDVPVNGQMPADYWEKNPTNLTSQLGIYPGQNGFPQFNAANGQYHATFKQQFKDWLDGAGAKFVVKKNVAKTSPANTPTAPPRPIRPKR